METIGNGIDYGADTPKKNELSVLDMFDIPENSEIALDFEKRVQGILDGSHEEEVRLKEDLEAQELEIAQKNSDAIKLLALMNQVEGVIH